MVTNTGHGDRLVCGCWSGAEHTAGCDLGAAETIAAEAVAKARADGRHQLVAALTALIEAGILRDIPDPDEREHLNGTLDALYEGGLLGAAT